MTIISLSQIIRGLAVEVGFMLDLIFISDQIWYELKSVDINIQLCHCWITFCLSLNLVLSLSAGLKDLFSWFQDFQREIGEFGEDFCKFLVTCWKTEVAMVTCPEPWTLLITLALLTCFREWSSLRFRIYLAGYDTGRRQKSKFDTDKSSCGTKSGEMTIFLCLIVSSNCWLMILSKVTCTILRKDGPEEPMLVAIREC